MAELPGALRSAYRLQETLSPVPMIAGSAFPRWLEGEAGGRRLAFRSVPNGWEVWVGEIEGASSLVLLRSDGSMLDATLLSILGAGSPLPGRWMARFAFTHPGVGNAELRLGAVNEPLSRLSAEVRAVDVFAGGIQLQYPNRLAPAAVRADVECALEMIEALAAAEPALVRAAREGRGTEARRLLVGGADANVRGLHAETAMLHAARKGDAATAAALVAAGWRDGGDGPLALAEAEAAGHGPVAEQLRAAGVAPPPPRAGADAREGLGPRFRSPRGVLADLPRSLLLAVAGFTGAVGALLLLASVGVVKRGDWPAREDPGVRLIASSILVFAATCAAQAWRPTSRSARGTAAWRRDHPWPDRVLEEDWRRDLAITAQIAAILVPFAAGLLWLARNGRETGPPAALFSAGFAALAVGFVAAVLRRALRLRRTGRLQLVPARLPAVPGERLEALLRVGGRERGLLVTVRAVATRMQAGRRGRTLVAAVLWQETRPLEGGRALGGGVEWPLAIDLPAGLPSTQLTTSPWTYWELYVHGKHFGPDAVFLLPVYKRG